MQGNDDDDGGNVNVIYGQTWCLKMINVAC